MIQLQNKKLITNMENRNYITTRNTEIVQLRKKRNYIAAFFIHVRKKHRNYIATKKRKLIWLRETEIHIATNNGNYIATKNGNCITTQNGKYNYKKGKPSPPQAPPHIHINHRCMAHLVFTRRILCLSILPRAGTLWRRLVGVRQLTPQCQKPPLHHPLPLPALLKQSWTVPNMVTQPLPTSEIDLVSSEPGTSS